jgi:hypothetical protein
MKKFIVLILLLYSCRGENLQLKDAVSSECPSIVSYTITPEICPPGDNGSIVVNTTGVHIYEWETGHTGSVVTGLSSGAYEVTLTNYSGCFMVHCFKVLEEGDCPQCDPIQVTFTAACN